MDDLTSPGTPTGVRRSELKGLVLGPYTLETYFSSGGMSEIWRATHSSLVTGRFLVKVLPPQFRDSTVHIAALHREATLTRGLQAACDRTGDSYFPRVVDSGTTNGIAFFVMDEMHGSDLGSWLSEPAQADMTASAVVGVLEQILEAMSLAHSEGVIHRDLKPENIFVQTTRDGAPKIRILDFGIAKATEANPESYPTVSKSLPQGTQQYMSPELLKPIPDAVTPACDVFAIGLIAYRMLLGRHPMPSPEEHRKRCVEGRELELLHDTPAGRERQLNEAVSQVLFSAVRFDPALRHSDAAAMLKALRAASEFTPDSLSPGTIVGHKYRILSRVGKGGMGAVYNVEETGKRERGPLVLKIVVFEPAMSEATKRALEQRFQVECEALYLLNHDSIPRIYANDVHKGFPFLVMQKAPGERFGTGFSCLLSIGGWDAIMKMAAQVASALDRAHKEGFIHRDIKPDNIMIDPTTAKTMVVDFGITREKHSELTGDYIVGTLGYCAPEQFRAAPLPASDQWSFAASFYSVLTKLSAGLQPGEAERLPAADRRARITERTIGDELLKFSDAPTLVKVPTSILHAVTKAMSHDPEDRYPSVTAFVEAMGKGIIDATEPVPGMSTELELRNWIGAASHTSETPIVLAPLAVKPVLLEPMAATESIRGASNAPKYISVAAAGAVLLALVGYVLWGRGGDKQVSMAASLPEAREEQPTPPREAVVTHDAAPAPREAVHKLDVAVTTEHIGQEIRGVSVQIDETAQSTPFHAVLAPGLIAVTVLDRQYAGTYECKVASESPDCVVDLIRKKGKGRSAPRRSKAVDSDESPFIDFRKPKDPNEDSPFILHSGKSPEE